MVIVEQKNYVEHPHDLGHKCLFVAGMLASLGLLEIR